MIAFFSRLKSPLCFFALKLLLIGFTLSMLWLDIAVLHTQILEISFTEISQELMLFACALLFWCAPKDDGQSGFNCLAAGFFGCLLMRELDGLFDPISHSAWCWPFVAIAGVALFNGFRKKNRTLTLAHLEAFFKSPIFATLSTGFAILLFSRVFGMGSLWHQILGPGYARLAKTTVEEGVELVAYSMWLAASIEHFLRSRKAQLTNANTRFPRALTPDDALLVRRAA